MFKKVLCCLFMTVISFSAWCEDLQTVMSYYQPDMSKGFIFISKLDMTLTLVDSIGKEVVTYPMACGRVTGQKQSRGDNRTPEGHFLLQNKHDASSWGHDFRDGKGFIKHAYGPWFLRLQTGFPGIGIHGTHAPESIGTRASEGCIRLENENVAALEKQVTIGMPVIIGPEAGVESLIAANVPSPKKPGSAGQTIVPRPRQQKPDPVVLNSAPKIVQGQVDIDPEKDLAEPVSKPVPANTPVVADVKPATVAVEPVAAETKAEPDVTETVAEPEVAKSEAAEPAEATHPAETTEPAEATAAEPEVKPQGGIRYEVVVEEVTLENGETDFVVRYVLLP